MTKSLECLVVQVDVGHVNLILRQRIYVHNESMILSRNFHLPLLEIHDRMVTTTMTEFEFVGSPPQRQSQQLMP